MIAIRFVLSAAVLALAAPALAQHQPQQADAAAVHTDGPVDPARLAAAGQVVDRIFPTGTYARLMNGTTDTIIKSMANDVTQLPLKDLARIGGMPEEELAAMGEGTLREMLEIIDPSYRQRMEAVSTAIMSELSKLTTQFEPGVREGLTSAYARRFTPEQLAELNRFFATPTGAVYASEAMTLFMDPEVMDRMMAMTPELVKRMPDIVATMSATTAGLPAARGYGDLSTEERGRLAKLLGISEADLARQHNRHRAD